MQLYAILYGINPDSPRLGLDLGFRLVEMERAEVHLELVIN